MDRKPPIYFDSVIIASPLEPIASAPNLGRLNVGVFTKYGNRNGSYITDEVAEKLIQSATRGDTPVVGFFDPETKDWAGHTGPTLASAYGYVEGFNGWQPFQDTDGVTRDYAVFSVVLFGKYFDEANFVVGQNQSMELDINSIDGDWADIDGIEYFVYTTASIMGLCIIGSHEPCFSVSSFFEKKQEEYATQYSKFSSLLADIKAQVEEAEKKPEGGERTMDENNLQNPEVNEPTPAQEPAVEPAVEPAAEPAVEPAQEPAQEFEVEPAEEPAESAEEPEEEPAEEPADEPEAAPEAPEHPVDFAALQNQIAELQASLEEVTANFENAQARIEELEAANAEIESLRTENEQLTATIATYAAEREAAEVARKNSLIDRYQNDVDEEEINSIREHLNDFSYEQLESKLAICYSNKHLAGNTNTDKVPLPEPAVNQFALLMEKYRKN